ncbi:hypothetical protein QA601_04485 [Chitinispirillales bacterium ANBcel5]|uniref:hypothetical protein n=1 Tax=Cellulosispirillum alkaliphilum TaxID=3039283 RepID=UPI002A557994|nr:hypothetical protein [Chitinispirillales bacterium ANBcel5]
MIFGVYWLHATVIILLGISVILAITNLFSYAKISSKVSVLEQEVYKQAHVLDTQRRGKSPQMSKSVHKQSAEEKQGDTSSDSNDTIEIVRNVRGAFNESTSDQQLPRKNPEQLTPSAHQPTKPIPRPNTPKKPPAQSQKDLDVLDVISEPVLEQNNELYTLPLYSEASKDADFNRIWQKANQMIFSGSGPQIKIDFSNISFLHKNEILCLSKIHKLASEQGAIIEFSNCDAEIRNQLASIPTLFHLIED